MKKALKTNAVKELYHFVDGVRIAGAPDRITGDISGLRGDISGLWGDISPDLWGDISGLRGQVDAITGNVDKCGLTDEDREAGVDIEELAEEDL